MIHILNGQNNEILDVITEQSVLFNAHKQSLENQLEQFDFDCLMDLGYADKLTDRNRLIIPTEDDGYKEFVIRKVIKLNDKIEVYTTASYLELIKSRIISPTTLTDYTATAALSFVTNQTEWRPGLVESDALRTLTIDAHTNPFSLLKRLASEFNLELQFRVETDGNDITNRYVDLLDRVGTWDGREVTFGKDLDSIERSEDTSDIYTALLCLGPEDADGNRLEVLVEDEEALQRWGRSDPTTGELKHLIDVYEPQSNNLDMTLSELEQYGRTELNKRINAVVAYKVKVVDLEHVPGMDNKKIRFGDTIRIKDEKFNPPLYVEARVFEQSRDIFNNSLKEVVLGDFIEYTEEQVLDIWESLQKQISFKIGQSELADYTYQKAQIDDKDGAIYTNSTSYAYTQAQTAQSNAEQYAYTNYEAVKTTVNMNKDTWDKASVFNDDGSLNVNWLAGKLTDDQIQSAGTWNGMGTYIDENGVYTGVVVASQVFADSLSSISADLGTVNAGEINGVVINGSTMNAMSADGADWVQIRPGAIYVAKYQSSTEVPDAFVDLTPDKFLSYKLNFELQDATILFRSSDGIFRGDIIGGVNAAGASLLEIRADNELRVTAALMNVHAPLYFNNTKSINSDGSIHVEDARSMSGSTGSHYYYPDPIDLPSNSIKTIFSYFDDGESWRSGILVKGWSGGYSAWRLSGPASSNANDNFYFQSGTEGTWRAKCKIWHDRNDGSGSGLDADLLDGRHYFDFLEKTGGTISGTVRWDGTAYPETNVLDHNDVGANLYVRPASNGEVRVTQKGSTSTYKPVRAASFPTSSSLLYKDNIIPFDEYEANRILDNTDVFQYHLKANLEAGIYDKPKIGVLSEMVPQEIRDEDGVDPYSMVSVLWKIARVQKSKIDQLEQRISDLEMVV